MSVQTGATVLARVGLALIPFLLTVLSHPARFTLTAVLVLLFNTFSMHTRLKGTVVRPRETPKAMCAGWTLADEPIEFVLADSATHTWVGVTLIDIHFTFNPCISWVAHTFVPVNFIKAISIFTGVAGTVIFIDLTVCPCSSWRAVTLVSIDQVDAASSVLAGVAVALLDLDVTDGACVSRIALTGEGGNSIFTHTMVAWLWYTVIYVLLTKWTSEAFSTFTIISIGSINTLGPI